jgi:hypothetical protein
MAHDLRFMPRCAGAGADRDRLHLRAFCVAFLINRAMSPNVPTEAARLAYSVKTGWTAFHPQRSCPANPVDLPPVLCL